LAKYSKAVRVFVSWAPLGVETEFPQMLVKFLMMLRRSLGHFDRDLDQVLAVRESPPFQSQLMRKVFVPELLTQHANGPYYAESSEIDRTFVELAQKALFVF
jgi:hypothetical protein